MFNIIFFEEIDSTNIYAKRNIEELNDHDVIYARVQTKGKGRMSRNWMATSSSLTFSIILKEQKYLDNFDSISLLAASSVFMALKEYIPKSLSIKWPNDIYYLDQKLVGILLESISYSSSIEGMVIGIGVNVNNNLEELKNTNNNSTSFHVITSLTYSIDEVLNNILSKFDLLLKDFESGGKKYFDIISSNNYLKGKKAYAHMSSIEGEVTIIDILPSNKLLVEYNSSLLELDSGEITFHK